MKETNLKNIEKIGESKNYSSDDLLTHTWFTSDWHLLHPKIVDICNRPIPKELHDMWLIDRINSVVAKTDHLYVLGDITLKGSKTVMVLLEKIVCENIHFIQGNHDPESFMNNPDNFFASVSQIKYLSYDFKDYGKVRLALSHYPQAHWNYKRHGGIHVHGHTHNEFINNGLSEDVGVDAKNFYPVNLKNIIENSIIMKRYKHLCDNCYEEVLSENSIILRDNLFCNNSCMQHYLDKQIQK